MKIEIVVDPARPAAISLSQRVAPASVATVVAATNGTGSTQRLVGRSAELGRIICAELRLERSWFAVFFSSPRMFLPWLESTAQHVDVTLEAERPAEEGVLVVERVMSDPPRPLRTLMPRWRLVHWICFSDDLALTDYWLQDYTGAPAPTV
jgi:hypothetical protein